MPCDPRYMTSGIFKTRDFGHFWPFWGLAAREDFDALDRKSTRLNSSHITRSRMPSSA